MVGQPVDMVMFDLSEESVAEEHLKNLVAAETLLDTAAESEKLLADLALGIVAVVVQMLDIQAVEHQDERHHLVLADNQKMGGHPQDIQTD